jgi:hypothetical protein
MKRTVLIFLLLPSFARAQLCFDFESGLLNAWKHSREAAWSVSQVGSLAGDFSLWHSRDDSLAGNDRISFAYDSLVTQGFATRWQFALRHGYNPSSSNKWAVYLLSDEDQRAMMPGGAAKGIVLGVNFKGSDDMLKLWKTDAGLPEIIAETNLNWQERIGTGKALLRVDRELGGIWKIYLGKGTDGLSTNGQGVSAAVQEGSARAGEEPCAAAETVTWEVAGKGTDTVRIDPGYFGIYYRFSPKQDMKFWFDDLIITGTFIKDTVPPSITHMEIRDAFSIRLVFSETVDQEAACIAGSYTVMPAGSRPDTVLMISGDAVELVFGDAFQSAVPHRLIVIGMPDRKGNLSGTLEREFTWYRAVNGDIIINEIMYDPVPEIGLPGYEYIELYNRSGFGIRLEGWHLRAGRNILEFPDLEYPPGTYLLLCYRGTADRYSGPDRVARARQVCDLLENRTFLSNGGAGVMLLDPDSVLIDWMEYSNDYHSKEYYALGGWALERIDPDRPCHGRENWKTSTDRSGGTPGRKNSVNRNNPDRVPPVILGIWPEDKRNLRIEFNEAMDPESLVSKANWRVDMNMGPPDSLFTQPPGHTEATLYFRSGFIPGREYRLHPGAGIKDCSGNPFQDVSGVRFALPVSPVKSDILISEILFDPPPYCPDFIELFNPTSKTFDLADLRLASRDPESGEIVSVTVPVSGHRLFFPGGFLAFTTDPEELGGYYTIRDPATVVKVSGMPAMPDKEGTVLVLDKYLSVLDEVRYLRDMHHPLLASTEGVSLERISYSSGSDLLANWHSASSTEGFATPGRKNSQQREPGSTGEGFTLEPEIFTPDLDGVKDVLFIRYRFRVPGLRARILVVDPRGRLIREIAGGELLGTEGFYTWDGTDHDGRRARTGVYLVLAEVAGMREGLRRYKKTCVLSVGR